MNRSILHMPQSRAEIEAEFERRAKPWASYASPLAQAQQSLKELTIKVLRPKMDVLKAREPLIIFGWPLSTHLLAKTRLATMKMWTKTKRRRPSRVRKVGEVPTRLVRGVFPSTRGEQKRLMRIRAFWSSFEQREIEMRMRSQGIRWMGAAA